VTARRRLLPLRRHPETSADGTILCEPNDGRRPRLEDAHGRVHASFEEHVKGSITPSKLADFVILEQDPHGVDPGSIETIKVMRTVVGGNTVHSLE
jgi:hypothetical protein